MNIIVLICNQFIEVRRTVRPTDTHWADFMGHGNGTSTNVQMGIRGHWERFPFKLFEDEYSLKILNQ